MALGVLKQPGYRHFKGRRSHLQISLNSGGLSAQRWVMAVIIPLTHYDFFLVEKKCVGVPPPPPPTAERPFFFGGGGSRSSSETFCPPPPKQTPWRRPCP